MFYIEYHKFKIPFNLNIIYKICLKCSIIIIFLGDQFNILYIKYSKFKIPFNLNINLIFNKNVFS